MVSKSCVLAALFLIAVAAIAASDFAGTWQGQENGLPAIDLTIRGDGDGVTGSIGFYFQKRGADGKWHLGEKYTVPLLSPKIEGRVLTFETIHTKEHASSELGPNNKYRVELVGAKEARIRILKNQASGDEPTLTLFRRE